MPLSISKCEGIALEDYVLLCACERRKVMRVHIPSLSNSANSEF